jgi:hypothetical protein
MATWIAIISAIAALITAIGTGTAVLVKHLQDRNKPALDSSNTDVAKATLRHMVDETNRNRDVRLWQLEGYVDLDRTWHRKMIVLTEELIDLLQQAREAGFLSAEAEIPDPSTIPSPPEIPEPPRV